MPVTCPKCHGKGTYTIPFYDDDVLVDWQEEDCEICDKTGKITLDYYEYLQGKMRGEEK